MPSPVTQYRTCRHVLASGRLCGCAALKDHIFCLHHQRDRQRKANLRAGLAAKFRAGEEDLTAEIVASLDVPAPDDPEAALVCLANTFLALAAGAIPEKRAALMIYNLQTLNSAFANLLHYRKALAEQDANSAACNAERAVTDPEPIASLLSAQRQADYEFSEQRYAQRLETEKQMPTADDTDETDSRGSHQGFSGCHPERSEGPLSTPRTVAEATIAEAAFNADSARMQSLAHPDLPLPAEAPHTFDVVSAAVDAMSADDWEKHIERLWLNGFIADRQRDKLHARIFHADRNVRTAARFLALKYAPDKVREVLHREKQKVPGSQYPAPGKGEEQIA